MVRMLNLWARAFGALAGICGLALAFPGKFPDPVLAVTIAREFGAICAFCGGIIGFAATVVDRAPRV
jgi:hypothetical protein